MKRSLITSALLITLFTQVAIAADANGKFAAKGAATRSCEKFSEDYTSKNQDYYLYGGWLEGYITGFNSFQSNTYDITPWQSVELLLGIIHRECKNKASHRFIEVANSVIQTVAPLRLTSASELEQITYNGQVSYHYAKVLLDMYERLHGMGYLAESLSNEPAFTQAHSDALIAYQKARDITPTGFPDQMTLLSIFYKIRSPEG